MKLNKKMIIMLASVIGVIVVLIIIMMLFLGGKGKNLSYDKIEEKIVIAAESYYNDNEDELPSSGTKSIDVDTLVSEGYLNELSKYTKEGVTCDGKAFVTKTASGYSYRVNLDCGKEHKTKTLSSVVTKDVVTSGSGLYKTTQVNPYDNSNTHDVYIFKGDSVKNYVKVGDFYWEIVKVYENGEIAVLGDPDLLRVNWDNRFNVNVGEYHGINEYKISRMLDSINEEVVEDDDGYLNIKSLITTHTTCTGKRSLDDTSRDGSAECSETLEEQYFSLLPVFDFMNASLDKNCIKAEDASCYNYNYLATGSDEWWTITGVGDNTRDVYYFDNTLQHDYASRTKAVRLYVHLDANVAYVSGTGTYDDPYIVK